MQERVIVAPRELTSGRKSRFEADAARLLESMPRSEGRLVVDMQYTTRLDSAGIGALVGLQQAAARRRQTVRLTGVSDDIHFLLTLTQLDDGFEIERS